MKKLSLPKIHFPFKKKTNEGPLWKISTKIKGVPTQSLIKSRKNKKPWTHSLAEGFKWFNNYFRAIGWVFFAGVAIVFFVVLFTTPFFHLNPDKIDIVLRPEPVFDRNAI